MQRNVRRASAIVGQFDPWLSVAFVALTCIGVLMVYSASIPDAYAFYGSPYYYLERDLIWVGVGCGALAVAARTNYLVWSKAALPIFGIAVFLLAVIMLPHFGHQSHGAQRWISFGSFIVLEPSELIKLALVIYLAAWLTSKGERIRDFQACFFPFSVIVGIIALMIVRQPDLGTAIVVIGTAVAIFYVAGAEPLHLLSVSGGAAAVAWALSHGTGYRHDRLTAFLNPWNDPSGVGYHTIQALLALRYGGVTGRGLGASTQKWLLPAAHTDSILAVIGEEWGMIGTVAVLLLFLVIAYRGMRIAWSAPDSFGRLLATGITCWLVFQALLNFAVITSSVPFTGVPLPFISYGGTSLVISMGAMGILLNISRHTQGIERANHDASDGRGDGRSRLSRFVRNALPGASNRGPLPEPLPLRRRSTAVTTVQRTEIR